MNTLDGRALDFDLESLDSRHSQTSDMLTNKGFFKAHNGPPNLTKGVRRFEHCIGEPRNLKQELRDRAAPRLAPPEVMLTNVAGAR
jgi:hypothetical protein